MIRILLFCLLYTTSIFADGKNLVADRIFINGNIYTINEKTPHAEAIAVKNKRILYVGSNEVAATFKGNQTQIVDLHQATLLPGLADAHSHFIYLGLQEMMFNLTDTKSLDDLLSKLKARVASEKEGAWIVGIGWIESNWPNKRMPTLSDLDPVSANHPVVLIRSDEHALVANSLALKLLGINKSSEDPFGGQIHRDAKTHKPDGILVDNAYENAMNIVPHPTPAKIKQAMLLAEKISLKFGLTQVQEPDGDYQDVALYQQLYKQHQLKIRVYKAIIGPSQDANNLINNGPLIEEFDHHFTLRAIKVIGDGALGSRGASLLKPYTDQPNSTGFMRIKRAELIPMLQSALRNGIQVETHAIGDKANRDVLNVYEQAFKLVPLDKRKIANPRWRIEHAQILDADDLPRFAKLNVIPSMQPSHEIDDMSFAEDRLGIDRLKGAYAWQALLKTGVIIPGGSDAPIESGNPLIEFYAAISRKNLKGEQSKGAHPEEALTREQALRMFTLWPAIAAFEENLRGSITVGKLADFTVLSDDIMQIPEASILKTRCIMTVIDGEVVFKE